MGADIFCGKAWGLGGGVGVGMDSGRGIGMSSMAVISVNGIGLVLFAAPLKPHMTAMPMSAPMTHDRGSRCV
jgi:hypothetical protein